MGERPDGATFFIETQLGPLHVTINTLLLLSNLTKPERTFFFQIDTTHTRFTIYSEIYYVITTDFLFRNKMRTFQLGSDAIHIKSSRRQINRDYNRLPGTSLSGLVAPAGSGACRTSNNFIVTLLNLAINGYNPRRPRCKSYTFFAVMACHFTNEIFDVIFGATNVSSLRNVTRGKMRKNY